MIDRPMVTQDDIRNGVRALGRAGRPIMIHSSLRSFGLVEGGPETVVHALLAEECTLMVPSFSFAFAVTPPVHMRPARNGTDYETVVMSNRDRGLIYSPVTAEIDINSMGAIPAALVRMEGRVRGNHPLNSFTALGPLAAKLISGQHRLDVYAPLRALCELDGWVLLMGVGLTRMTLLHLAELMAGRNAFLRWANGPDGKPMYVQTGSCSNAFNTFTPILAPYERTAVVGSSRWRAYPAAEVVAAAVAAIHANPGITHCGDPACARCRDAVAGGPILPPGFPEIPCTGGPPHAKAGK